MGNKCRALEEIISSGKVHNRGPTYKGLIFGVRSFLRAYQTILAKKMTGLSLMDMDFTIHLFHKQIDFVSLLFEYELPGVFFTYCSLKNSFDLIHLLSTI